MVLPNRPDYVESAGGEVERCQERRLKVLAHHFLPSTEESALPSLSLVNALLLLN
jgi:hypothetical protein